MKCKLMGRRLEQGVKQIVARNGRSKSRRAKGRELTGQEEKKVVLGAWYGRGSSEKRRGLEREAGEK